MLISNSYIADILELVVVPANTRVPIHLQIPTPIVPTTDNTHYKVYDLPTIHFFFSIILVRVINFSKHMFVVYFIFTNERSALQAIYTIFRFFFFFIFLLPL